MQDAHGSQDCVAIEPGIRTPLNTHIMNRYQITITIEAQEFKVWLLAKSEQAAKEQVHIKVERDTITKRMNTPSSRSQP